LDEQLRNDDKRPELLFSQRFKTDVLQNMIKAGG
jgi:hypothetical protein